MAAAAMVLLASHFEEYIRQQIEEYAKALIEEYQNLEDDFRESLIDVYWRAGSAKLNRIKPRGDPDWGAKARILLRSLNDYPVDENIGVFDPKLICEHENNMRWETIADMCKRVGVKKMSDRMFSNTEFRDQVGTTRRDDFARAIRRKMNEFYEIRNGIVHSIAQNSGIGPSIFLEWSSFFRSFTTAFAASLQISFDEFGNQLMVEVAARECAASE